MNTLTSDVREAVKFFLPTVWASVGVFLVFIQAGFAVDSPAACHFVWTVGYNKADLTDKFVWRCVHKLAVISTSLGSIGSHLLHLKTVTFNYLLPTMQQKLFCTICKCEVTNNSAHPVYVLISLLTYCYIPHNYVLQCFRLMMCVKRTEYKAIHSR